MSAKTASILRMYGAGADINYIARHLDMRRETIGEVLRQTCNLSRLRAKQLSIDFEMLARVSAALAAVGVGAAPRPESEPKQKPGPKPKPKAEPPAPVVVACNHPPQPVVLTEYTGLLYCQGCSYTGKSKVHKRTRSCKSVQSARILIVADTASEAVS